MGSTVIHFSGWLSVFIVFTLVFTNSFTTADEQGYFWQLTDLHYDAWYTEFGRGSCNKNLTEYGLYGDFECDPPWTLVASSIGAMKTLEGVRPADFILLSGDHTPHARSKDVLNESVILNLAQNITNELVAVFPTTLVLPVLGNHDYWPKNQLPGHSNYMYHEYGQMWSMWLTTNESQTTFRTGGYYSLYLNTSGLLAVCLNTNLYYHSNNATVNDRDPGNQYAWLNQTLTAARHSKLKVLLFLHVPVGKIPETLSGTYWLLSSDNTLLSDIITQYSDVIVASFSCHSHADSYKLFYANGVPMNVQYISPSITPWRYNEGPAHNPALRKVIYSKNSQSIVEIQQYYLDLDKANRHHVAEWQLAYSYTDLYKLKNMSPASLNELLIRMNADKSSEFENYYNMNTVNTHHPSIPECNCTCKTSHLCGIQHVEYGEFDTCYTRQEYCEQDTSTARAWRKNTWVFWALYISNFVVRAI